MVQRYRREYLGDNPILIKGKSRKALVAKADLAAAKEAKRKPTLPGNFISREVTPKIPSQPEDNQKSLRLKGGSIKLGLLSSLDDKG